MKEAENNQQGNVLGAMMPYMLDAATTTYTERYIEPAQCCSY